MKRSSHRFLAALNASDAIQAIAELERTFEASMINALQLQVLYRSERAGAKRCSILTKQDEQCSSLEQRLEGKLLSFKEARDLVRSRGEELCRSVFLKDNL